MLENVMQEVRKSEKWLRALYMILFIVIVELTKTLLFAIVVLQFILVLFTNRQNSNLLKFSKALSRYVYEIYLYLTYNAETKPFPFGDWPKVS
ncbi:MAG: DUF4389 domain-containing protein [Deltaproteobacteria bacterium]|nr:DUF4389 domain-containing protein [Deltaproteobacteria bacterium]